MALAQRLEKATILSYDDYLTEGETPGQYEIVDGVRHWMTGCSPRHNDIVDNIVDAVRTYARSTGASRKLSAPLDIVTQREPLKDRQPDVSLISSARWNDRDENSSSPLADPPELVVEVLSPSETKSSVLAKMIEYASGGVRECWLVKIPELTIESWTLSEGAEPQLHCTFAVGDQAESAIFDGLKVDVATVFAV